MLIKFDETLVQKANKSQLTEYEIHSRMAYALKVHVDGVNEMHFGRIQDSEAEIDKI
jgi:hypothetical protein